MYKLIISCIFIILIGYLYYRYKFFIKKDRGIYIFLFLSLLVVILDVLEIFNLNDSSQYKRLSIAIYELSIGYIAGFFIYYLTILRREHEFRCAFYYKYITFLNSFLSPTITVYYKNKFKKYKKNLGYGNFFCFVVPDKNVEKILNSNLNETKVNNCTREKIKNEIIEGLFRNIEEIRKELDENNNLFKVKDILKMEVTINNLEIFLNRKSINESYNSLIDGLKDIGKLILDSKKNSVEYLLKSNHSTKDVKCELTSFTIRKSISNEMKKEILEINDINSKEVIIGKMNNRKQTKLIKIIDDKDKECFIDENNCKYLLKDLVQIINYSKGYLFIFEKSAREEVK